MPIKSQAQRRKFAQLLVDGEISPEVFERWNREAGSRELPERLHPKVRPRRRRKAAPRKRAARSATRRAGRRARRARK